MEKRDVLCSSCADNGRETKATKLAPQIGEAEGTFHWLPICEACADGWFDDPPEDFPGDILPISVVLRAD